MKLLETEILQDFIKLKGKVLADYNIIYHINDCYSVEELTSFYSKHQLLFQKFENKIQQMNLVIIDSIFPLLVADLALDVFINKVSSFNEYIDKKKTLTLLSFDIDRDYLKYKFFNFIHHLLYSEISLKKIYTGVVDNRKIYCLKDDVGELQFYSIYEQNELQLLLLDKLHLEIKLEQSVIHKEAVKLNFQITVK